MLHLRKTKQNTMDPKNNATKKNHTGCGAFHNSLSIDLQKTPGRSKKCSVVSKNAMCKTTLRVNIIIIKKIFIQCHFAVGSLRPDPSFHAQSKHKLVDRTALRGGIRKGKHHGKKHCYSIVGQIIGPSSTYEKVPYVDASHTSSWTGMGLTCPSSTCFLRISGGGRGGGFSGGRLMVSATFNLGGACGSMGRHSSPRIAARK